MISGARPITASGVVVDLGGLVSGKLGKDVDAAGDGDQFRDPGDAGNHGIVPFLEIHFGMFTMLRVAKRVLSRLAARRSARASAGAWRRRAHRACGSCQGYQ